MTAEEVAVTTAFDAFRAGRKALARPDVEGLVRWQNRTLLELVVRDRLEDVLIPGALGFETQLRRLGYVERAAGLAIALALYDALCDGRIKLWKDAWGWRDGARDVRNPIDYAEIAAFVAGPLAHIGGTVGG